MKKTRPVGYAILGKGNNMNKSSKTETIRRSEPYI